MSDGEKLRDTLRKRNQVLQTLIDNPQTKSELTESVSTSHSTVERAIRSLQELGCIELQNEQYHVTLTGKLSLNVYQDYVNTTDDLAEIHKVIDSLPETISLDREFINGASKHIADPKVPETALSKSNKLLNSATKLTGLAPLSLPSYPDLIQSEIQENNLEVELVVERDVLDSLYEVRGESFANFIANNNTSIFSTDEPIPCAIWIMETPEGEHAGITVYNQSSVQAVLINDREEAVEWARETYEKHRENSSKIEKL